MTSDAPPDNVSSSETTQPLATSRRVATAVVIGLTLLSGIVHGYLDGRWTRSDSLIGQGSMLANLPEQIGDWKLTDASELEPKAAQLLRCYGSTICNYQHRQTGVSVKVAIMFGPRGPIAVHTPEVCYTSVGTQAVGVRRLETIAVDDNKNSLWSVQFAVDSSPDPTLEVWYGWSSGEAWEARDQPRFWLTENLYKIQVAGPAGGGGQRPVRDFVTALLPHTKSVMP